MLSSPNTHFFMRLQVVLFSFLFATSCVDLNQKPQPKKITWDRDRCHECGMAISDRHYAAQIALKQKKNYLFDDIGCALKWLHDHPSAHPLHLWVSAKTSQQWLDADNAFWTSNQGHSPMGFNFAAYAKQPKSATISYESVKQKVQASLNKRVPRER